jgi:hypothetical protein
MNCNQQQTTRDSDVPEEPRGFARVAELVVEDDAARNAKPHRRAQLVSGLADLRCVSSKLSAETFSFVDVHSLACATTLRLSPHFRSVWRLLWDAREIWHDCR